MCPALAGDGPLWLLNTEQANPPAVTLAFHSMANFTPSLRLSNPTSACTQPVQGHQTN